MGKIAFVDLSDGSVRIEETPQADLRAYLGGRGLGAAILARLTGPATDPLGPDNVLVFTAGLLTGSPWPASSRMHVTFKSPLTGAYGYANCGGHVGPELKHAGFDAVVVSGRAPEPSILEITGDGITVRPAPELWGKTAGQADAALRGDKPGREAGHVACIGPAGENLVRIAAIITDRHRAAARGGPGAVMGSKQLKAIHVARGSARPGPGLWPRPPATLPANWVATRTSTACGATARLPSWTRRMPAATSRPKTTSWCRCRSSSRSTRPPSSATPAAAKDATPAPSAAAAIRWSTKVSTPSTWTALNTKPPTPSVPCAGCPIPRRSCTPTTCATNTGSTRSRPASRWRSPWSCTSAGCWTTRPSRWSGVMRTRWWG